LIRIVKAVALLAVAAFVVVASFVAGAVVSVFTHTPAPEVGSPAPKAEPQQQPSSEGRPAAQAAEYLAGADLARSATLFASNCAGRHLRTGKGDLHHRKDGNPDFNDATWQGQRTDAALTSSVTRGKGTAMPAFRGKLKEDEIRVLVRYVREFPARAAGAAPQAPDADSGAGASPEDHHRGGHSHSH